MPTCLYIRGVPGTGKHTAGRILERDLGWPMLWVHDFDPIYKVVGDHRVPRLTDQLISVTASYLMENRRDLIIVRPSRESKSVSEVAELALYFDFQFVVVRLTADYRILTQRVTRRWHESPFRITTKEGLNEYLFARKEEDLGEHVIPTDHATPEQVAGRIKELLP